jgi:uncharacterized protein YecE (DUF72 family)
MSQLRIGTSGWRYGPWRGVFYPKGLAQRLELSYMAERVTSIEINGSFYSLQRPESYRAWFDAVSDDFVFSVKAPRFITHLKRLRDVETPLANFFASGVLALEHKLGPILWQFPERVEFDERFQTFFELLPRSTQEAADLSRHHDEWLGPRSLTTVATNVPLRHAIEIRSRSFCNTEFIDLLRRHEIALVVADTAGRWPLCEDVTSDFVYVRLHGDEELYTSGYTDRALDLWADRVLAWAAGSEPVEPRLVSPKRPPRRRQRDVFVYFDNDAKVRAPFDAMGLIERVRARLPSKRRAHASAAHRPAAPP